MRAVHRWGLAAVATALVMLTPYAGRARPAHDPDVSTADLVTHVRDSAAAPFSGTVDVHGRLGLPIADHFTDLADLFGGETRLRVWWRGSDDWRVDRLLDTGEVDLFHHGQQTTEWDYERREARASIDPEIRLPRDSDLLPPEVARLALEGADPSHILRLSARRVAGVDAAGLRVEITDTRSSIRHVDLWVDPETGIALAVEVYDDASQPALSTMFTTFSRAGPDAEVTRFRHATGVPVYPDPVLDIADAADQFASVRAPGTVAGLARAKGASAAVYGTGLTRLLVLPLPDPEGDQLACRLSEQGARKVQGQPLLRVGPLGALVSRGFDTTGIRWLVTGTVTDETLLAAAADLAKGARPR
jgi:hypothetical protein